MHSRQYTHCNPFKRQNENMLIQRIDSRKIHREAEQEWFLKLICNVNIVYGDLKSENSQDYLLRNLNENVRS
jgi:hypothetical protein